MPIIMMNPRDQDIMDDDAMMMKDTAPVTDETAMLEAYASGLLEPEEDDIDDDHHHNEDSFLADNVEDLDNILGQLGKELRSSTTTASLSYLRDSMASSLGDSSVMGSGSLRSSSRRRLGIRAESSRALVEKEKQTEQEALEEYNQLYPLDDGEDNDDDDDLDDDGSASELEERLEKLHNIKSASETLHMDEESAEMTMAQQMRKKRENNNKSKTNGCLLGAFTAPFRILAKPFKKKKKKTVDPLNQVRHGGVPV